MLHYRPLNLNNSQWECQVSTNCKDIKRKETPLFQVQVWTTVQLLFLVPSPRWPTFVLSGLGSHVRGQMLAGWNDSLFLVQTRLLFKATERGWSDNYTTDWSAAIYPPTYRSIAAICGQTRGSALLPLCVCVCVCIQFLLRKCWHVFLPALWMYTTLFHLADMYIRLAWANITISVKQLNTCVCVRV